MSSSATVWPMVIAQEATNTSAIEVATLVVAILALVVPACLWFWSRRRPFSVSLHVERGRDGTWVVWRVSCKNIRSVSVKEVGLVFENDSRAVVEAKTASGQRLPQPVSDGQPATVRCSIEHVVKRAEDAGCMRWPVVLRPYARVEHGRRNRVGQPCRLEREPLRLDPGAKETS